MITSRSQRRSEVIYPDLNGCAGWRTVMRFGALIVSPFPIRKPLTPDQRQPVASYRCVDMEYDDDYDDDYDFGETDDDIDYGEEYDFDDFDDDTEIEFDDRDYDIGDDYWLDVGDEIEITASMYED
jgi:hypothetical protein